MPIPPSGIAYPNLAPLPVAQGDPPAANEERLICFADLLHAVVIGDPDGPRLRLAEAHFRDLHGTDYGAAALRQLRAVAEEHGCHPALEFGPDAAAIPMITMPRAGVAPPAGAHAPPQAAEAAMSSQADGAPQPEAVPASRAYEAMRAAVAVAAQAQLRLVCRQYVGLLSGTVANPASFASASTSAAPAGPIRRPRVRARLETRHRPPTTSEPLPRATVIRDGERRLPGAIVEQWTGRQNPELATRWNGIAGAGVEPSVLASFKKFLLALTFTHIHKSAVTREEVTDWLQRAAEPDRADLRAEAFRICDEGSSMCHDNALLTWNRLKMLMLKNDVLAGRYAGELRIICKLGLDTLRMDTLEAIAQDKIIALHKINQQRLQQIEDRIVRVPQPAQRAQPATHSGARGLIPIDPIEIMLDYHVSLRKEFNLPLSVEEMTFTSLSVVTPQDIEHARDAIKRIEGEWFHEYLLLDFSPFLLEVRRQLGPEKCAEVEAELHAGLEGFEDRLLERLRAAGTSDNEQARRNMGVRLERELRYSIWLPHANAVLGTAGLAPLPPMRASSFEMRPWATEND